MFLRTLTPWYHKTAVQQQIIFQITDINGFVKYIDQKTINKQLLKKYHENETRKSLS